MTASVYPANVGVHSPVAEFHTLDVWSCDAVITDVQSKENMAVFTQ